MENIWSSYFLFFHPLLYGNDCNFSWKMDGTWPVSSNRKGPFFQRLWSSLVELPQGKPRPPQDITGSSSMMMFDFYGYEDLFFAQFSVRNDPKQILYWHILSRLMVKPVFFLWFWNWLDAVDTCCKGSGDSRHVRRIRPWMSLSKIWFTTDIVT